MNPRRYGKKKPINENKFLGLVLVMIGACSLLGYFNFIITGDINKAITGGIIMFIIMSLIVGGVFLILRGDK